MPLVVSQPNGRQKALNPIHPDILDGLDLTFVSLGNKNVANTPKKPVDSALVRPKYSGLYSYGTGPAPDVGRIYESKMPMDKGKDIDIRVYEPSSSGPWPVHVDFHGGHCGLVDLDTGAHICQHTCHKAGVAVIDIA